MDTIERILIYFLAVFYILLFILNHNNFHPNVATRSRQASVVSPSDSKKSNDGSKKSNDGSKKSRSRKAKDASESGKTLLINLERNFKRY